MTRWKQNMTCENKQLYGKEHKKNRYFHFFIQPPDFYPMQDFFGKQWHTECSLKESLAAGAWILFKCLVWCNPIKQFKEGIKKALKRAVESVLVTGKSKGKSLGPRLKPKLPPFLPDQGTKISRTSTTRCPHRYSSQQYRQEVSSNLVLWVIGDVLTSKEVCKLVNRRPGWGRKGSRPKRGLCEAGKKDVIGEARRLNYGSGD